MKKIDIIIVGAGLVGISTAYNIKLKYPKLKVTIIDKERKPLCHQSGRNSGVVHAGVYYKPGSLKAKFCVEGLHETFEFCKQNNLRYLQCGKLISATNDSEITRLHNLFENSNQNGLSLEIISKNKINKLEPNLNAIEAIYSPMTGIVDWGDFGAMLLNKFMIMGGDIFYNFDVMSIEDNASGVRIIGNNNQIILSDKLVVCGGLNSDRLAELSGFPSDIKIIPFRGDYYKLDSKYNNLFKHLIYPVPDPELPFLGIHFTRIIDGSITIGPNAALNFSREGYDSFNLNLKDTYDIFSFKGFWNLLYKHKEFIIKEISTSLSKEKFLSECRKYYSNLNVSDLLPFRSGIRAQAVTKSGDLVHDFKFIQSKNILHVINAPSPAATSSLPIGRHITSLIMSS